MTATPSRSAAWPAYSSHVAQPAPKSLPLRPVCSSGTASAAAGSSRAGKAGRLPPGTDSASQRRWAPERRQGDGHWTVGTGAGRE